MFNGITNTLQFCKGMFNGIKAIKQVMRKLISVTINYI